jgi:hypothetical protein
MVRSAVTSFERWGDQLETFGRAEGGVCLETRAQQLNSG